MNKTSIAIALILLFALSILVGNLPSANAQGTLRTWAFIGAVPNPVGVGQEVLLHIGITQQLSLYYMGWEGLSVTITKPDGSTETISNIRTDSTGGTGRVYVPNMPGNYTLQAHFPEQVTTSDKSVPGVPAGTRMLASSSEKLTLVVLEEPVPIYTGFPLPAEFWTRPINAQFHEWVPITGNWLRPAGGYTMPPIPKFHPNNEDAPETAHILWTKQYTLGGIAGSPLGEVQFEMGDAYEGKFAGSVIISGILYYNQFESRGEPLAEQIVVAVDLRTGKELWAKPLIGRVGNTTGWTVPTANIMIDGKSEQYPNGIGRRLAFGQLLFWDSFNYHGVFGYLWTSATIAGVTTWQAFDALTGRWVYTITNVPSGYNLYGPKGELYRYSVDLTNGWIALWNATRVVNPQNYLSVDDGSWRPHGNVYNSSGVSAARNMPAVAWAWNVTIPKGLPGAVAHYSLDNRILGSTSSAFPAATGPTLTSWAISTKKGEEGRLIFNKTWQVPSGLDNASWAFTDVSFEDGVFIISCKENLKYYGFSLDTGDFLWETEPEPYLAMYDKWYGPAYGYGKFYTGRMSGRVTCYDIKTGKTLWTYDVKDKYWEILWSNNFPIRFEFIADGKIYLSYGEHSPINPTGRGAPLVCLNATTGEEIWKLSWFSNWWGGHVIIGDSIMAGFNGYDNRIYAIGKGPSATTVAASPEVSVHGSKVLLKGMITDVSPGTKDAALAMRFPNGVPAVADECMSDWMQYVYMQYPSPNNVKGVEVVIEVLDPNGNYYEVARAVSDGSGFYSATFEPPVPGKYTIIARFPGSKSYWGSYAETAIYVEAAPPPTPPPTPTPASVADVYFVPAVVGLLIAIIAVGTLTVLLLRKR
ncbi:MAG: PQQ-binding-like beta-propeller repeat protein [Candidatus Bathyarchaeia archaeon]